MMLLTLLPLVAFILLWLFFLAIGLKDNPNEGGFRKALILAGLFWSAYLVLGTELLNLLGGLTTAGVALLWAGGIIILSILQSRIRYLSKSLRLIKEAWLAKKLTWFGWLMLVTIIIVLVVLLITGLLSPPNVHDVLSYHFSRVMHWVQNKSLVFFPTPNSWQLWMPPFSEFSNLHWYLLTRNDLFSFLPQWYSLILIMAAVSLTAKQLDVGPKGQWLSAFFVLSLPIIVLQASGGKNDIVLGFFFAALVTFVVNAGIKKLDWYECIASGLCVGLGILTKGTFTFFALVFLVWLFVSMLKRAGWKGTLAFIVLGVFFVLLINAGHWARNTRTFGNPLYTAKDVSVVNARFGLRPTVSNLSRHIVVQLNGKYGFINIAVEKAVIQIHDWMNMNLFDPAITHGPGEFYYVPTREEVAGNPFHFALTGLSFFLLMVGLTQKPKRSEVAQTLLLSLAGFASLLLFSAVFRWQAWGTRFLIPYYLAFAPVVGFVFSKRKYGFWAWLLAFALGLVILNPLLNNYSRSFSWSENNRNSIWRMSRTGLLFANNQNIEGAVIELATRMEQSGCRTYGLVMRPNAPEYLLWGVLNTQSEKYVIRHIHVGAEILSPSWAEFDPCGIILFEMTTFDWVDQANYHLVERWQIGDSYPFSLFLIPDFMVEGLE